jgi:hypothetical protein
MGEPITTALLVTSGALTGASLLQGSEARSDQRKAARVQKKIQERQVQRERIKQIREARIQQARVMQQAATQGATQSSAVQGASANITQQASTNLGFINQVQGLQQRIQGLNESASKHAGNAQTLGGLAGLAAQGAMMSSPAPSASPSDGNITLYSGTF